MKNLIIIPVIWLFVLGLFALGCDKKDPVIPVEEELITTLILNLQPLDGGAAVELAFRDLDGDGGNPPEIKTEPWERNTVYEGQITLLNESVTPVEDITEEIQSESAEHQFFFHTDIPDVDIDYNDQDSNGYPVGLKIRMTTAKAGSGKLTITLRHQPNKTASGVAAGDITLAGGETDIEVNFDIDVQ